MTELSTEGISYGSGLKSYWPATVSLSFIFSLTVSNADCAKLTWRMELSCISASLLNNVRLGRWTGGAQG